jgi:hypothetical protein
MLLTVAAGGRLIGTIGGGCWTLLRYALSTVAVGIT